MLFHILVSRSKAWEKPEICTKITLWHSFTRLSTFQGLFIPMQKLATKNLYKMLSASQQMENLYVIYSMNR